MNEIFLSYRRAEHPALIGRIHDRLTSEFGQESVFLDVDSIPLGANFEQHLKDHVSKCTVFVAVIGTEWLKRTDSLFRKDDFIRIELDWAIRFGKPIIPLLVGVEMPSAHRFPEELRAFSGRNGMTLDPGQDFHIHMARLVTEIGNSLMPSRATQGDQASPNFKTISQVVMNVIDEIQFMLERPGTVSGISSGFADLDLLTNGFEPCGTYVFAAEPNTSISCFLNSIVQRILKFDTHSVLWIDTESNEETVGRRLISSMGAVDMASIRRGLLSKHQQDCLANAVRLLQKSRITIISAAQGVRSV
jgi:hypothetical protein